MKKILSLFLLIIFFLPFAVTAGLIQNQDNPVFKFSGVSGAFDQTRTYHNFVTEIDGSYRMYYSGVGIGNSIQIGLAESTDGINWQRDDSNPIFKCSEDTSQICSENTSWSSYRVSVISVTYDDGLFKLWYRGDNKNLGAIRELGFATSSDGLNWNPYSGNPVHVRNQVGTYRTSLIKISEGYRLYFSDISTNEYFYIDSNDGIDWSGPEIKIGDGFLDSVGKVNSVFIGVKGKKIATSSDGIFFDFDNSNVSFPSDVSDTFGQVSFILDGDVVKVWRDTKLDTSIGGIGNYGIYYYEIPKEELLGIAGEDNSYPLYTQIESPYPSLEQTSSWADDLYAGGGVAGCPSFAACGCAVTSLVMAARSNEITTDVLGGDVNPGRMNEYLTNIGGYPGGVIDWLAAQVYLGEYAEDGSVESRFLYNRNTNGLSSADSYLQSSTQEVLGYKGSLGHFVWLPELTEESEYLVRDPRWYNTMNADDDTARDEEVQSYNNSFDSTRVFDVLDEPVTLSGMSAYLEGTAELLFENVSGQVGFADGSVVIGLDRSSYGPAEYVSDEQLDSDGKYLLVQTEDGVFSLSVIGTSVGEFNLNVFTVSASGDIETFVLNGQTIPGITTTFEFNLETGEVVEQEITLEQFIQIIDVLLGDATDQQRAFFMKRAEKLFNDMEEKTVSQALQQASVFRTLLEAKKINEPAFFSVIEKITSQIGAE